jgi:hypothetical protein
MNNLILNTLNDNSFKQKTWLWKHLRNCFENNAFIFNRRLLKLQIWINKLIGLLKISRIHIEFHSKLFILTKHGLNSEIIKLSVNFFLLNLNQMVVMNFEGLEFDLVFKRPFEMIFVFVCQIFCAQWVHNWNI